MAIFQLYGTYNAYIEPYSSSTDGGELITEFNQRAQLNLLGYRDINLNEARLDSQLAAIPTTMATNIKASWGSKTTPENFIYQSYLSGTKDTESFKLSQEPTEAKLNIAAGEALIYGYYVHGLGEVTIPLNDLISASDMLPDMDDNEVVTRYIKLQMTVTIAPHNMHDERLVPPLKALYEGFAVVCDNELPKNNQLLLGTISRTVSGSYIILNNPLKTELIDKTRLMNSDLWSEIVMVPDDDGENIYAIQKGGTDGGDESDDAVTNLVNINEYIWLAYSSSLGKYLRNMSKVPDDAGKPNNTNPLLGMMVGYTSTGTPTTKVSSHYATAGNTLMRLGFYDEDKPHPYLAYRVLKDGQKAPDCYEEEYVPLPFASYTGQATNAEITVNNGRAGIVSPETKYKIDQLWDDRDSIMGGVQFGPFESVAEAVSYFNSDVFLEQVTQGYKLVSSSGSGHYEWTSGRRYELNSFGLIDQNWRPKAYFWVLNDTITIDSSSDAGQTLFSNFGQATATYTATTSGDVTAKFNATSLSGPLKFTSPSATTTITGNFSGTMEVEGDGDQTVDVAGTLSTDALTTASDTGATTTFEVELGDIQGQATGKGSGTLTYNFTEFTQNVSARYIINPNKYKGSTTKPSTAVTQTNFVSPGKRNQANAYFVQQAVLRGFACPATDSHYGFLRPSSTASTDPAAVINDPSTNQLRLGTVGSMMLQNGGWKLSNETAFYLNPEDTAVFENLEGLWFVNGCTLYLRGTGWNADTLPTIHRMKGDIKVDISEAGFEDGVAALVTFEDVNDITIINTSGSKGKINVTSCTVTTHNFNNINRWVNSKFDSGSNVATLDNSWVTVDNVFKSDGTDNSLQTRFATFTRGEYGITSAELDIWIKYADWTKPRTEEALSWQSLQQLHFPPLLLKLTDTGNVAESQIIPTDLNAKVSGTGGTHRTWDSNTSSYVLTGNWISTVDWEDGDFLSVNARMLSPDTDKFHGVYDLRFRALVQFTQADDMMESSIDYGAIEHLYN